MKDEYDFRKGERGNFYRPNAVFRLPIYLDESVQTYLVNLANAKGIGLSTLVSNLLKLDIEIIETGK